MNQNLFDAEKEFFVIDSQNLEQVQTKLYGYTIIRDSFIQNAADLGADTPRGDGAYIYIRRTPDTILIKQDFIGSYGLYLFQEGAYFALSNSFLKLVDHIKKDHKISFNKDYANVFLCSGLCSVAYGATMVNEIQCLDRCAEVEISIPQKQLTIQYFDYQENTVELSSQAGIKILDEWYFKWTRFIKNTYLEGTSIQADLSGGFDSRLTLILILGAGIDLNNVYFHSIKDDLHTHIEDYEIASAIGAHFGFPLNKTSGTPIKTLPQTMEDLLNISFYLKLGFHTQMHFRYSRQTRPRHYFAGSGGECVRSYWSQSETAYIEDMLKRTRRFPNSLAKEQEASIRKILQDAFDQIRKKFEQFGRTVTPEDMTANLYRETRCRNHFGKELLENYYGNQVRHAPLLDADLHRLKLSDSRCADKNLLIAVMLSRYHPDLLQFKFEGQRKINADTIAYAEEINRMFPFNNFCESVGAETLKAPAETPDVPLNRRISRDEVTDTIQQMIHTGSIKGAFLGTYGPEVYQMLCEDIKTRKFHPLQNAYIILSIAKILQDVQVHSATNCSTVAAFLLAQLDGTAPADSFSPSLKSHSYLENYITARFDLSLASDSDEQAVLELADLSDTNATVRIATWLPASSQGYAIESTAGVLQFNARCSTGGKLTLTLKGKHVRRKDGSRIPFWIDYHSVMIDHTACSNNVISAWHDAPARFTRTVKSGEIVHFSLTWGPHDHRQCIPSKPAAAAQKAPPGIFRKAVTLIKKIVKKLLY